MMRIWDGMDSLDNIYFEEVTAMLWGIIYLPQSSFVCRYIYLPQNVCLQNLEFIDMIKMIYDTIMFLCVLYGISNIGLCLSLSIWKPKW